MLDRADHTAPIRQRELQQITQIRNLHVSKLLDHGVGTDGLPNVCDWYCDCDY